MKRRNFLIYSALFLSGCAGATIAESPSPSSSTPVERPTELRFAVTDISGLDELEENFEPFRVALESVLGIPVTFYAVPNYSAAAPALLANDLDIALAGPSEYLLLRGRAQAEPLVNVTRPDYYSMIKVRADSGITSLADLKGQTIAMRTEGSTAGHIFPIKLLKDAGVNPDDIQIKMFGDQGMEALVSGEVAAWADSHNRFIEFTTNQGLDQGITVLAQGDPLPGDIFVANPSLGPEFIKELRSKMLAHQDRLMTDLAASIDNQKYRKSTMKAAQDSDYDTMRSIYRAVGLDSAIQ